MVGRASQGDAGERSLAIALSTWSWPPSYPFLRACLLEAYASLRLEVTPPVLDLACGDGRFARALVERGVVARIDAGLDWSQEDARAAAGRLGRPVVVGDLTALPFADGVAGTVLCNTALDCLYGGPADLPAALAEIRRVLRPGGSLVASVHLRALDELLTGVRILRGLGLAGMARAYAAKTNREAGQTVHMDLEGWRAALEPAGLAVEQVRPLMDARAMRARSLLRLLKLMRPRGLARALARRLLAGPMAPLVVAAPAGEDEPVAGVVLVARRAG
ncbi:MAG: class I SAM-dependent methyltransferase [Geminicoccaceae bacterium]|nr:class I SAM-dependent methyltransferase [Geminicoccaceae bacterium]